MPTVSFLFESLASNAKGINFTISPWRVVFEEFVGLPKTSADQGTIIENNSRRKKKKENPDFTLNYKEHSGFPGFFPGVFLKIQLTST